MSLITANSQLMSSLVSLFQLVSQINALSLYSEKIQQFFKTPSYIEMRSSGVEITSKAPFSVDVKKLKFNYPNSNFGLNNIDFHINPKEKIAIVGNNGAGKTTLVKLLVGLYDGCEGTIEYNGQDIRDYNILSLRNRIGVAYQNTNAYALPFKNNLSIYSPAPEKKIEDIVTSLKLDQVLEKSSATIDTEMTKEFDSNGIIVSGGELQKIGIGRIMMTDFGLLILDEPSASLDPIAEAELASVLFSESNKTTTIIISHRLSMVKKADRIVVMQNGQISEVGNHEELMQKKGVYFEMFTKQAEQYI